MSYYAKIVNDKVVQVIVSDKDFADSLGGEWVQTSYDTVGNVHKKGGTPLRKNYASIGYTYNRVLDAFIPPKPFNSWVLDKESGSWHAPIRKPLDTKEAYFWDESKLKWEIMLME